MQEYRVDYWYHLAPAKANLHYLEARREYYHGSKLESCSSVIAQSLKRLKEYLKEQWTDEEAGSVIIYSRGLGERAIFWHGDEELVQLWRISGVIPLPPILQIFPEEGKSEDWNDRTLYADIE